MKEIKTQWTGIRPLIMSNPQTIQLSNKYAVESRRLGRLVKAARKKNEEDRLIELEPQQIRNDWESSCYWDDCGRKFFIPDTLLIACIRNGATAARKGKDIDRAVIITETQAYIEPSPHKTLDAAFLDPSYRLECPCRLPPKTGSLVWKARCMIPTGWRITFSIEFDDVIVSQTALVEAIEAAGRLCGIGGWRPKFGRFISEVI